MPEYKGNEKIKIGFISHSSGLRGAERALLEAIDALRSYPLTPHVFVPSEGPFCEQLRELNIDYSLYTAIPWITTRRTLLRSLGKTVLSFPATMHLAWLLRKNKCQLVYSNSMAIAMGAWAAYITRMPHLWHIHEFGDDDHGHQFDKGEYYARWVFNYIGGIYIFNSHAVARKMNKYIGLSTISRNSKCIYQSVTLGIIDNVHTIKKLSDQITLILVGAYKENKGQVDAILAVKELISRGIKIKLLLVGNGPYKEQLKQLVCAHGLQNQVQFVGFVENVTLWYEQADIVLVCSKMEAFGRVAIEGMLAGKPIIVAKAGGLQEIVEEGVNGLCYQPGDNIELADKINLLISDSVLLKKISENGYEWAESHFTKERYGRELYETIFSVLVNESG